LELTFTIKFNEIKSCSALEKIIQCFYTKCKKNRSTKCDNKNGKKRTGPKLRKKGPGTFLRKKRTGPFLPVPFL